ncbi:hypothetical protein MSAN_00376700 [Mycena sanguinolenta]|uniref:Uncharacterized protein n=1 Tax=Mycena sanguinolenta TaxID=230812 RepID=A0A8H7DKT5_9AGAR|nr:hypothetical protein MSAN_00376700 [Mycena sanguinolenta]
MSELDSLSDTEWTEISNQSDNDSLSDCSRSSEPPSRRSSISIGSSVDGHIDAWEGFADDSPDELELVPGTEPVVPAFVAGSPPLPDTIAEEQFVNAALEQSLVGTLSASRSSSLGGPSTVHSSLRDLRLSFPDPITSSRDELNRSYEAVSSSETHCITDDVPNSPMTTDFPGDEPQISVQHEPADQLRVKLESLPEPDPLPSLVYWWDGRQIKDFDLVLYGSTSQSQDFAQWFLSILASAGVALSYNDELRRPKESGNGNVIAPSSQTSDRPSLAIVSLPASFGRLPKHTVYLPVIFPAPVEGDLVDSLTFESWSSLADPPAQTLRIVKNSESQVVVDGAETRNMVDPRFVYQQLVGPLLPSHTKKPLGLERAVTVVGLLLMIMGFTVNTFFRVPTPTPAAVNLSPATTAPPSSFWNMFGTTSNSSVAPLSTTTAPTSYALVMPSTLKEMALAVLNPATTTATTTPTVQVNSISVAPPPSDACGSGGESKPKTPSEKSKSTKDVIVRPPTSLSNPSPNKAPPTHTPSVDPSVGKVSPLPLLESAPVTSLSLKLVDSLSQVVDATMKALEEVVGRDLKELMTAIDTLMRAIGVQVSTILADSKSQAQILREVLKYRNERAKGKARELMQTAEQFMSSASERLKARAEIAKTRAKTLTKTFMGSSVWRTYAEAHGEWIEKLEAKREKRRERKRERKGGSLFSKLKERRGKKRVSN